MDLELLGRARAAATYGVAARSPGCCAQRLGLSARPARKRHATLALLCFSRIAAHEETSERRDRHERDEQPSVPVFSRIRWAVAEHRK
jgi:hypothetical protein